MSPLWALCAGCVWWMLRRQLQPYWDVLGPDPRCMCFCTSNLLSEHPFRSIGPKAQSLRTDTKKVNSAWDLWNDWREERGGGGCLGYSPVVLIITYIVSSINYALSFSLRVRSTYLLLPNICCWFRGIYLFDFLAQLMKAIYVSSFKSSTFQLMLENFDFQFWFGTFFLHWTRQFIVHLL